MHVTWDEQVYGTGFEHLDAQHRELFDGLNSLAYFLEHSPETDTPETQAKVIELLYFLAEYIIKHFRDEEELFTQCNHPLADANKDAHQAFVEHYFAYNDRLMHGVFSRDLLIQLHHFLHDWLLNHIVKVDISLRACAAQQNRERSCATAMRGVFTRFLTLFQRR